MTRHFIVASSTTQPDGIGQLTNEINRQYLDRGIKPTDLDGMDASFLVAFTDAVATLGGTWEIEDDDYYVSFITQVPASQLKEKHHA